MDVLQYKQQILLMGIQLAPDRAQLGKHANELSNPESGLFYQTDN
jgi:hypothetical protein